MPLRSRYSNYAMRCVYERHLAMVYARETGSCIERRFFVKQAKKINHKLVRDLQIRTLLRKANVIGKAWALVLLCLTFSA